MTMSPRDLGEAVHRAVNDIEPEGKRILVVLPDLTRTCPVGALYRSLGAALDGRARSVDYLVALGTHPPLTHEQMSALLDLSPEERTRSLSELRVHNHAWRDPGELVEIGRLAEAEVREISDGRLARDVVVTCNRLVREVDHILLVGPVFPHEVAGFSGGNKYIAPGIAGPDIIHFFHWLGALITNPEIIGVKWTPVREVIDRVAAMVPAERSALCLVMDGDDVAGAFHGTPEDAWARAADLSTETHIAYHPRPYREVLSCAPAMYDELWVGGKCMYKLEPVVEDGGRLIIYAPHIERISATHGATIEKIGYHTRDYFLAQWERFRDVPWGVLAHSTHVRGIGTYENGIERPRIEVVLATGIPRETCERINLGYADPESIDPARFEGRVNEGVLCVPRAGEMLHRLAPDGAPESEAPS